ncbi:carbohydrate-binding protein [Cohnella endophytica]|uniref:beta-glucosidase n=1 Tax=Cohnella endophytica TaxID=2419778 RepID=A0A494YBC8_9BACL|nr:chitobiase/beta-hexosaminidase C-terminal domain-containing protein [Cohnella endophytica]RKP57242.1 carbohydrate-binding protein [Cohnella endophytica]
MFAKKTSALLLIVAMIAGLLASMAPTSAAPGDPGKIEAENYSAMSGIQTEVCSEGGLNVSYIDAGDWMDYAVNIPVAGAYNVDFRVSSPYAGTQLQLRSGATTLTTVTVPNTGGYQTWQTVTANVNLSAGNQTLRVYAVTNGWNFNWMNIASSTPAQQASAPTFTPAAGTYASAQSVTLTSGTAGATIKYTIDGSTPTAASLTYSGAINVTATTTVKAIALKSGMTDSAASSATYMISAGGNINLALNKPAYASSYEGAFTPSSAVDGNAGTRWSSQFADPQWIYVDLGSPQTVGSVRLNWETASAKAYKIQVSANATAWTDVYTQTNGAGNIENVNFAATTARYVRMYGTARNTGYGYSLWEFEVYGQSTPQPQAVDIPVTGPYAQYLEMGLSPADLNQTTTLKSQNATIGHTIKYNVGTAVTIGVNYMVEQKQVTFRTTDANGNVAQGNPLTFTVHPSSAVTVVLTDRAESPAFSPSAGTYASAQSVTLTSATSGATIKYTTDGSTPTAASATYSGVINVAATTTIKAIATKSGLADSAVSSATYTITTANVNLALNKSATASSSLTGNTANAATDGNAGTRWESEFSDPQWIYVDLGSNNTVAGVKLNWETASAKSYKIQVSTNATAWTDVYTQTYGAGGVENISITPVTARYVRMYGTTRNTGYGYSLWEFEVYGQTTPLPPEAAAPTFSPAGGNYTTAQSVTLSSATAGATIKYTTDGSTPTASSPTYTGAINIAATTTVKAIATKAGMTDSAVSSATYTITAFKVLAPVNGQMVTNTRTPTLSWEAKAGTVKYEVWVNLSRTDYDWNASGNLLDRYTKIGETTGTTIVAPSLVDRWTYKWYVIGIDGSGNRSPSSVGQFSVYLPYIEQVADGINVVNGSRDLNKNGTIEPYEDWHNPISVRVDDLMSRMTNEEKINQLFFSPESLDGLNQMAGFVFSYGVTGFITDAQKKVSASQRLGIPIAFTGDKIDGWQTAFPTELGLAATRNLNIAWQVGDLQRREQKAWGFTGSLSPLAEVDTKVLYPRFQEGTGENADYSAAMVRAIITGMQGGPEVNPKSMMITVKHWPSQGAGGEQSIVYDSATIKWHMKPWYAAMDANAATVMPGYGGSPYLDPANNGAGTSKPTLDFLRNVIGFNGIVMTDWLAASTDISVKSIGAGSDVMGGAVASGTDFNALIASVGWPRLNEAVRRVLDLKFRLGMFENPYGDPDYPTTIWHSVESNNIVNEAARQSLTLLKNNGVLPLKANAGDTIVVAGPRATSDDNANDNIANVIWQSIYHDNPAAKSYYQGIKDRAGTGVNVVLNDATAAKAAVVVIGERSYTHGTEWADKNPTIPADQIAQIDKFYNRGIPVVCAIVMPRPYVLTDIMNKCGAVVVLYRPGNGGGVATAGLLFGDYLPKGKLPFQLPRSLDQIGTDDVNNQLEKWDLPYDLGATEAERAQIRSLINNNQPVPTTFGNPLFPYGYGLQSFTPG